jgi:hypothetical protein
MCSAIVPVNDFRETTGNHRKSVVTHRTAAYLGATTEFSKWEGITYDTKRNRIYTAMSEIREGMEDKKSKGEPNDEFDAGGRNDIKLEYNPCGCGALFPLWLWCSVLLVAVVRSSPCSCGALFSLWLCFSCAL